MDQGQTLQEEPGNRKEVCRSPHSLNFLRERVKHTQDGEANLYAHTTTSTAITSWPALFW